MRCGVYLPDPCCRDPAGPHPRFAQRKTGQQEAAIRNILVIFRATLKVTFLKLIGCSVDVFVTSALTVIQITDSS